MFDGLDELDRRIIESIPRDRPRKIIDIIRPFLKERSERALRYRVKGYYFSGYIDLKKQASCVLVIRKEPGTNPGRGESLYV